MANLEKRIREQNKYVSIVSRSQVKKAKKKAVSGNKRKK